MNQEFVITGMTCQNCKKGVESKLNSIDEISKFLVDLESSIGFYVNIPVRGSCQSVTRKNAWPD